MEEDNGVYKNVVIFLLSICVISLALGIYANYRLIVISKQNEQENKDKNEKIEVIGVEEETEINDELVLDAIKRRQIVLKNYTDDQLTFKKSKIYEKDITSKELEEERKLVAVVYTIFENDKNYELLDREKYPNIVPNRDGNTVIIGGDIVKGLYSDVFGGNLDTNISFPETIKEQFYYNQEYDLYVINTGFGGSCVDGTITYDYKYMEDSENVYVYSTYAYYKNCPYEVFKDLNMTEKVEGDNSFELNNDNYESFNKYKITYKKDGNKYIFKNIELIK